MTNFIVYLQRKYDVGEEGKRWILKDLSLKWKYQKYVLRKKYFKGTKKGIQQKAPEHLHITADMWKEATKLWTSQQWVV